MLMLGFKHQSREKGRGTHTMNTGEACGAECGRGAGRAVRSFPTGHVCIQGAQVQQLRAAGRGAGWRRGGPALGMGSSRGPARKPGPRPLPQPPGL